MKEQESHFAKIMFCLQIDCKNNNKRGDCTLLIIGLGSSDSQPQCLDYKKEEV